MGFGENLKRLRKQNNLSHGDLAKETGLAKSTISLWENGRRVPSYKMIKMLKNYFNVSYSVLLGNGDKEDKVDLREILTKEEIYFDDERVNPTAVKALMMFLKHYRG